MSDDTERDFQNRTAEVDALIEEWARPGWLSEPCRCEHLRGDHGDWGCWLAACTCTQFDGEDAGD